MTQPRPPSPCINICTLDDNDHCVGCLRTLDEIAAWAGMSPTEQWQLVVALRERAGDGERCG